VIKILEERVEFSSHRGEKEKEDGVRNEGVEPRRRELEVGQWEPVKNVSFIE
jgi:hypothetical protein